MIFKAKTAAIEFAGDEVRVAVCKAGGKLPVVLELAACSARYDAPEERPPALAAALGDALDSLEHRPAAFVLCINSLDCIVRTLNIPFRGRRRVAAAVQFELEPYLAFPIEDLMLEFDIIGEFDGGTEVLAMGIRRSQLEETLAIAAETGIQIDAVNLDVAGLTGLWQGITGRVKGLQAVLHVREKHAALVVTYDGGLAFFRSVAFDAETAAAHPAALAREVQNSLRSFLAKWRGKGEITTLSVTGTPLPSGGTEALEQALRMPIEQIPLFPALKGAQKALAALGPPTEEAHWEAALGVGSSASGDMYGFNFAQATQSWQGYTGVIVRHLFFSSCLALLFLMGCAFFFHQGTIRNEAEARRLESLSDALGGDITALGEKGLGSDVDTRMFSDPTLLALMQEIALKMPGDKVTITELKISPPEAKSWWMRIQGTVSDAGVFNEVFNTLKGSALFEVQDEPDLSLQGELTTFAIKVFRINEQEVSADAASGTTAEKETGSEEQS